MLVRTKSAQRPRSDLYIDPETRVTLRANTVTLLHPPPFRRTNPRRLQHTCAYIIKSQRFPELLPRPLRKHTGKYSERRGNRIATGRGFVGGTSLRCSRTFHLVRTDKHPPTSAALFKFRNIELTKEYAVFDKGAKTNVQTVESHLPPELPVRR